MKIKKYVRIDYFKVSATTVGFLTVLALAVSNVFQLQQNKDLTSERDYLKSRLFVAEGVSKKAQAVSEETLRLARIYEAEVALLRKEVIRGQMVSRIIAVNPKAPATRIVEAIFSAVDSVKEKTNIEVAPLLALAVIEQESHYWPMAKGSAGERGLMQLTKTTAASLGLEWKDAYNIEKNVLAGVTYLGVHFATYKTMPLAVRRYNGGGDPEYLPKVAKRLKAIKERY